MKYVMFCVILLSVSFQGCSETKQMFHVKVGLISNKASQPFSIARDKGFFREEGVFAQFVLYETGWKAMDALSRGEIDFAMGDNCDLVNRSFTFRDFLIIASFASFPGNYGIGVRKGRGISSPADLKGRTIGVPPLSDEYFFLHIFLIFNMIQDNQVSVVFLSREELSEFPFGDELDAVVLDLSDGSLFSEDDSYVELFFEQYLWEVNYNLVVSKAFLARAEDVPGKLLRALIKTESFIPGESCSCYFSLDQAFLLTLEEMASWVAPEGTPEINFLNYVYVEPLVMIDPERVSMIH